MVGPTLVLQEITLNSFNLNYVNAFYDVFSEQNKDSGNYQQ